MASADPALAPGTNPRSRAAAWDAFKSRTLAPNQSSRMSVLCWAMMSSADIMAALSVRSKAPLPTITTGRSADAISAQNGCRPRRFLRVCRCSLQGAGVGS